MPLAPSKPSTPQPQVRRAQPLVAPTPAPAQPNVSTQASKPATVTQRPQEADQTLAALVAPDSEMDASLDDGSEDADETVDLSTVDADEAEADLEDADSDHAVLQVFKPECLKCGHLVSFAEHRYKSCHFTAGNTMCPAEGILIQIQIPVDSIVRNFIRAEEAGDSKKLSKLYSALATKPSWAQRQITAALASARAARKKP